VLAADLRIRAIVFLTFAKKQYTLLFMTILSLKKNYKALFCAVLCVSLSACITAPPPEPVAPPLEPVTEPVAVPDPVVVPEPVVTTVFDSASISEELKQTTFIDIRKFIETLNTVIQTKDFTAWNLYLTDSYREYYSKSEVLAELSNQGVIKRQGIVLKTLKDYFINVVFPSRQNDRVDAIEYIGQTRVKAFTTSAKGDRLVLYTLEKIGDTWKITR